MSRRIVLVAMLFLAVIVPVVGSLSMALDASNSVSLEASDFVMFGAITVLGCSAVAVGVTILWRKPGNRIGLVLGVGGLMLMSVFAAFPVSFAEGASGDTVVAGLTSWWGTIALLPAIALLFPAVGILFPDERLPTPRWRWPVGVGVVLLATGVVLEAVAPWSVGGDYGHASPNPFAIGWLPAGLGEVAGGLAALGTFILFPIAVAAVIVRFRRSTGVERAQQKWLMSAIALMAIVFPLSFATDIGPADLIDLLSVVAGALIPVAVGIAVLRYHVFEIDRVVSRGIAYGLLTAVLATTYATVILILEGPLGTILGGETISVALSTLVVAALFQPLRARLQRIVDRRFDRARFNADLTSAVFSERLRDQVDIEAVSADLDRTVRDALKPSKVDLWLRDMQRPVQ